MSVVLGYATKEFGIIMSDGRAGKNGCVSETFNKTLKVNDNIIIGYVGFLEPIQIFLTHILNELGTNKDTCFLDDILELFEYHFKEEETQNRLRSTFMLIGKNRDGMIQTVLAGNATNYIVESNAVLEPRFLQMGGSIDANIMNNIYIEHMKFFLDGFVPVDVAMSNTIRKISTLDTSINTNVFVCKAFFN